MPKPSFEQLVKQANNAVSKGNWQTAYQLLEQAQNLKPRDAGVITGMGTCLLQMGKPAQAFKQFLKVTRLAPDNLDARNNLGIAATLAGDLAAAEEAFKSVIQVNANHAFAWKNLAQVYLRQPERAAEGVQILASVVKSNPRDVEALLLLANIYQQSDDLTSARTLYQRVLELEPENTQAKSALEQLPAARPAAAPADVVQKLAALKKLRPAAPTGKKEPAQPIEDIYARGKFPSVAYFAVADLTPYAQFLAWSKRLAERGVKASLSSDFNPEILTDYSLVVFSNPHLSPSFISGVNTCIKAKKPFAVDLDQDFFSLPEDHPAYVHFGPGNPRSLEALEIMIKSAAWVSVPSPVLADRLASIAQKTEVIRPIVDVTDARWKKPLPRRTTFNIGWIGGAGDRADILSVRGEISTLLAQYPQAQLVIAGDIEAAEAFTDIPEDRRKYLPLSSAEDDAYLYSQYDLFILPLKDTAYNRARSPLRLVEAHARGVAWLASQVLAPAGFNEGGQFFDSNEAFSRLAAEAIQRAAVK